MGKLKKEIRNNKREGSALAFVIIAFMIISIFAFSILNLFNANLKQTKYQQDALEAYYLAYSGAEMALASLVDSSSEVNGNLKKLTNNTISELKESNISFGNGKITVISKKTTEANFDGWIQIESTAILNKNNQKYTRILYFDPKNPIDMVWIK